MKSTRNAFVEKAKQSTFVPKWGLSTRPSRPLVDGETPGPSEKTETVITKSVISVSPLPDSQVKIEWAEGTKTESVIAASCSISSQGDVLTITYKCPPSDTLSTKKANDFFHSLNLTRVANHTSSAKSSGEQVITCTQRKAQRKCASEATLKENQQVGADRKVTSCINAYKMNNDSCSSKSPSGKVSENSQAQYSLRNLKNSNKESRDKPAFVTCKVVNRETTSKTLSPVELNQTERVSIEESTSVEDARKKATTSEYSSCKDVHGELEIGREESSSERSSLDTELDQKLSSDEEVDRENCKIAVKRHLSSPTEGPSTKLLKVNPRFSGSYIGQIANCSLTSSRTQGDKSSASSFKRAAKHCANSTARRQGTNRSKTTHRMPPSSLEKTRTIPHLSSDETISQDFFTASSKESSTYHSTVEESRTTTITSLCQKSDRNEKGHMTSCATYPPTLDEMEMENSRIPFPKVTMRSYQNISGNDVWELSLRFH